MSGSARSSLAMGETVLIFLQNENGIMKATVFIAYLTKLTELETFDGNK